MLALLGGPPYTGQITCYKNRTDDVLATEEEEMLAKQTFMEYHSRMNRSTGALKKEGPIHHF
jgi:hypothetical protein